jgi:hypothetical protein
VGFSAEADIVTGVIVTVVGIDAVRHVHHGRESAMAALQGGVPGLAAGAAGFTWRSLRVIPWLVPYALRQLETDHKRGQRGVGDGLMAALAAA